MIAPHLVRLIDSLFPRPSRRDRRRAARLGVERLEGRDVPTTFVTVEALADAAEGGADGAFRLTRTGSTAQALYVGWPLSVCLNGIKQPAVYIEMDGPALRD